MDCFIFLKYWCCLHCIFIYMILIRLDLLNILVRVTALIFYQPKWKFKVRKENSHFFKIKVKNKCVASVMRVSQEWFSVMRERAFLYSLVSFDLMKLYCAVDPRLGLQHYTHEHTVQQWTSCRPHPLTDRLCQPAAESLRILCRNSSVPKALWFLGEAYRQYLIIKSWTTLSIIRRTKIVHLTKTVKKIFQ